MTRSLQESRTLVRLNIAVGVTLGLLIFGVGIYILPPGIETDFPSDLEKLVYTIKWQSLSVMMLLFGIERVESVHAGRSGARHYDDPNFMRVHLVGWGLSLFVCCLVHRGSIGGSLILQVFSGVVWQYKDLQLSRNMLYLSRPCL